MSYLLLQAAAREKGLKPTERCVLINLADRANQNTKRCYPSVGRIAKDMCISEREVYRVLKTLREAGLVSVSGHTYRGTSIYVLNLHTETGSSGGKALSDGQVEPDSVADDLCQTVSTPLTDWHTNSGTELGFEEGKKNMYTSAGKPTLAYTHEKSQPTQHQGEQAPPKAAPPPVAPAPLPKSKDSKLVRTWKAAHAVAGLKCHIDAVQGNQLSMLVKGENAIPYHQATDILIPRCVPKWTDLCTILSKKYGISLWGKKPVPKWPHTGFLLAHRQAALEICALTEKEFENHLFLFGAISSGNSDSDFDDVEKYGPKNPAELA